MDKSNQLSLVEVAVAGIDRQAAKMRRRVERWSAINTGSLNREGIEHFAQQLLQTVDGLGGQAQRVPLPDYEKVDDDGNLVRVPLADAIRISKRPAAPRQALLVIHLDTVFGPEHPFQQVELVDDNTLRGPGVADAKGGLAVMLAALEALEQSDFADRLGWTVLLNPDEELGSPGSSDLLEKMAQRSDVGLVYEPTLPDGSMISQRKGSGYFTTVVRGRCAHVGRHFREGRNAIDALAGLICEIQKLNEQIPGVLVNTGRVSGGRAANVVPDLAIGLFNVRVDTLDEQIQVEKRLRQLTEEAGEADGITVHLRGGFGAPPKPFNGPAQRLFQQVAECARALGNELRWQPSGGVCDGNRLAAVGLPTVDTLGPRGGGIHTAQEFLLLDSLAERAKLSALLLMRYAIGDLTPPTFSEPDT